MTTLGTRRRAALGALAVLSVFVTLVPAESAGAAAKAATPSADTVQVRPVLATITRVTTAGPPTAGESAAIASCDPAKVTALAEIPAATGNSVRPRNCTVLRFAAGQGSGALYVGPARITALDIAAAHSNFQSGQGYEIVMSLTKAGVRKLNAMARNQFALEAPQNQLALVVHGEVFSNPAFQTSSFSGDVSITGNFTAKEARRLAHTIDRAARAAH